MAKPKLALIPASQGTKLYSVLPADGVGDFTFSRNSAATRINKDGLIETVAVGKSRLNYPLIDGVVNGCPSHLLEPSRSNLLSYSEDFSQSYWLKTSGVGLVGGQLSPDGTNNAYKFTANSNNAVMYKQFSGSTNTNYNNSIYAKRVVGNGDVILKSVQYNDLVIPLTTEWQRFNISDLTTSDILTFQIGLATLGDEILIYGAQIEQGSYATSYIPNYGTSAGITRVAETANGAGDASTFNDSEGVLMVETKVLDISTSNSWISLSEDANINNNQFNLRFVADSNLIQAVSRAGGLGQDVVLQYTLTDKTLTNKISIKYKLNDWALWVNGFEVDTETSSNAFTPNSLDVLDFDRGNNSNSFYGNTKQIQYFDSALNDSDLETITSWTSFTDLANGQTYSIK